MNLSISNIAWDACNDELMYNTLLELGYTGLEIAPTRIFDMPVYDKVQEISTFSQDMQRNYGLSIVSMQSIWYGRSESIFGPEIERDNLLCYTKKAIKFAEAAGCPNLVFGCPKNRNIRDISSYPAAVSFFQELGENALRHNTVIAMEANPAIYNTNFVNFTREAFSIVKDVNSKGFLVNLDFGTIIENKEELSIIVDNMPQVNHIHISEPYLQLIQKRSAHVELAQILRDAGYNKYISIEMKDSNDTCCVKEIMKYVKEIFGR